MKRHVGGKDGTDDLLAYSLVVTLVELLKDIILVFREDFKSAGNMEVLQYAHVIVAYGNGVLFLNQKGVAVAWVAKVVAGAGEDVAEDVPVVELALLPESTVINEPVESLGQVSCVRLIVITDV